MEWHFSAFETVLLLLVALGFWSCHNVLAKICDHMQSLNERHELHLEAQGFTWHRLREAAKHSREFEKDLLT